MHVDAWAILDLVERQRQVKAQGRPLGMAEGDGRDEHTAAIELKVAAARVDDQITDNPAIIVEQEIQHATDVAIGRAHRVPFEVSKAPQHGIPSSGPQLICFLTGSKLPCVPRQGLAPRAGRALAGQSFELKLTSGSKGDNEITSVAMPCVLPPQTAPPLRRMNSGEPIETRGPTRCIARRKQLFRGLV